MVTSDTILECFTSGELKEMFLILALNLKYCLSKATSYWEPVDTYFYVKISLFVFI